MTLPSSNEIAREIKPGMYILADYTPYDDPVEKKRQLFFVQSISKSSKENSEKIVAPHVSTILSNLLCPYFTASSATDFASSLTSKILDNQGFNIHSEINAAYDYRPENHAPRNVRDLLFSRVDQSFVSLYGGEAEINNYDVWMHTRRGADRGVVAYYGKNIEKFSYVRNTHDFFTSIYPYYESGTDFVELPEKLIYVPSSSFLMEGYRTEKVDLSSYFDDKPTEAQLREKANIWLDVNSSLDPAEQIDLSFSDPEIETRIGDDIHVVCEPMGIEERMRIIKTVFDCKENRYVNLTLGKRVPDLPGTLIKMIEGV